MDSLGLSNALEQQANLTQNATQMNNFINEQNGVAMQDYHQQIFNKKSTDHHETETQLAKIGAYGMDGVAKLENYREAIKSGKIVGGAGNSLTAQRLGKIAKGDFSDLDFSKTGKGLKADDPVLKGVETAQDSLGDATEEEKGGKLLLGTETEGVDIGKKIGSGIEGYVEKPLTSKILGVSGQGESFLETATREATGEILKTPAMKGASTLEKLGSGVEGTLEGGTGIVKSIGKAGSMSKSVLEGVGRTAGGLMSAAMLGDDIYNQVSNKKFFTGDNTGEKIGNFSNEVGSVMDLAGAATGDPFLVMAGVGVGAMGSVVSEISGLFHHNTDEKQAAIDLKPVAKGEVAAQNIVGSGMVAESSKSTLN